MEIVSPLDVQSLPTPPTQVFTGREYVMESPKPLLFPATANTQDLPLLRHLSLYLMLIIMMRETIFVMQPTLLGQVKVQEVPLRLLEVSYSYILVNRSTFDI